MERLTTNKPVDEMSMLELAYNSCYAKDGKAIYEDFETVRDARDFARSLYKGYLDEELPTDDEDFDGRMMDDLQYESEVHLRGLIALFYRNLWAMADLRETLKAYEDKQEQGLLIDVPVKPGDDIYFIKLHFNGASRLGKITVNKITIDAFEIRVRGFWYDWNQEVSFTLKEFNKTWFLTETEAEEALARMKGE